MLIDGGCLNANNKHGVPEKLCLFRVVAMNELVPLTVSSFTELHRTCLNLEFETLYASVLQVAAVFWKRKGKCVLSSKTALLLFSSNVKIG